MEPLSHEMIGQRAKAYSQDGSVDTHAQRAEGGKWEGVI